MAIFYDLFYSTMKKKTDKFTIHEWMRLIIGEPYTQADTHVKF
jgi:hypothetical protein